MKRIALFSGSFNPIHIGHTALANYICEYGDIDEVWFSVTPHNPLKKTKDLLAEQIRIKLLKLALQNYPRFKYIDIEMQLPRPSYTYKTLLALKEQYPKKQFVLIIGSDNWELFDQWKNAQAIIKEFGLIIYPRLGFQQKLESQLLPDNVKLTKAPIIEISSTIIREAFINKKELRFFLNEKVYEYIKQHTLYTSKN